MLVVVLLFLLSFAPFAGGAGAQGIVDHVFRYSPVNLGIGLQLLLPGWLLTALLFVVSGLIPFLFSERSLIEQLQISALVYIVLAPGLSPSHYVILLALWALTPDRLFWAISIPVAAAQLAAQWGVRSILIAGMHVALLIALIRLYQLVRRPRGMVVLGET